MTDPRPPLFCRLWWLQVLLGVGCLALALGWLTVRDSRSGPAFAVWWALGGVFQVALGLHNRRQARLAEGRTRPPGD